MSLKLARLEAKLTQQQLAKLSGVAASTISRIETGSIRTPSQIIRTKLEEALNRPIKWETKPEKGKTYSLRNIMEWKAQLEWIEQALNGETLSDVALSFPLVKRVHALVFAQGKMIEEEIDRSLNEYKEGLLAKYKGGRHG